MHYQRWKFYGDPTVVLCAEKGAHQKWLSGVAALYRGTECLLWPFGNDTDDRPTTRVDGKTQKVSRVLCEMVHGAPPSETVEAAHSCGNGNCVNPQHLRWATHIENEADKVIHGTLTQGERNCHCRLTPDDVRSIRALYGTLNQKQLGDKYGVSFTTIAAIVTRRSWAWLS